MAKPMTFAIRLEQLRKAAELSQYALANLSGESRENIRSWESGESMPRWDRVCRLADALKVGVEEFR